MQVKQNSTKGQIGPLIVDLLEELEMQLDEDLGAYFEKKSIRIKHSLPDQVLVKSDKSAPVLVDAKTETKKLNVAMSDTVMSKTTANRMKKVGLI